MKTHHVKMRSVCADERPRSMNRRDVHAEKESAPPRSSCQHLLATAATAHPVAAAE